MSDSKEFKKPEMTAEETRDFVDKLNVDIEAIKPLRFFYAPVGQKFGVFFNEDATKGMNLQTATKIMERDSKASAISCVMLLNRALLDSIKQLTKKAIKYSKKI